MHDRHRRAIRALVELATVVTSEYCNARAMELCEVDYEVDVLDIADDGAIVHVVPWCSDGPLQMAIGEQSCRLRQH